MTRPEVPLGRADRSGFLRPPAWRCASGLWRRCPITRIVAAPDRSEATGRTTAPQAGGDIGIHRARRYEGARHVCRRRLHDELMARAWRRAASFTRRFRPTPRPMQEGVRRARAEPVMKNVVRLDGRRRPLRPDRELTWSPTFQLS